MLYEMLEDINQELFLAESRLSSHEEQVTARRNNQPYDASMLLTSEQLGYYESQKKRMRAARSRIAANYRVVERGVLR